MRKLMTIRKIDRIDSIENADAIEAAVIGGWKVVTKKGEFAVGDSVIFFEIDSFLPEGVDEFAFLVEKSAREAVNPQGENVRGHVLRTVRLRGQISQGLILPLAWGLNADSTQDEVNEVQARLGVFKWEPPMPAGHAIGNFPEHMARKTDSERVQNLSQEFLSSLNPDDWFATEKIDGTSATFVKDEDGTFHIAGRNWELDPAASGKHGDIAKRFNLPELMPANSVLQGEIFGDGIQGNPLGMRGVHFLIFTVDVKEGAVSTSEFDEFVKTHSVPVLDIPLPATVEEALDQVYNLKSTKNPQRQAEGVVWWNRNGEVFEETGWRPNWKAINNRFLEKAKD